MHDFLLHLRNACRSLLQRPGFALAAVITLALGIGATTAIYSMLDRLVLNPVVYRDPGRVVAVWGHINSGDHRGPVSIANFKDLQAQCTQFEGLGFATGGTAMALSGDGPAESYSANRASWNLLPVLGLKPMLGRNFTPSEDSYGGPDAVILGYRLWLRRFGGDPTIVGRRLRLNGVSREVVGVLGPETRRDMWLNEVDMFIPFAPSPAQLEARATGAGWGLARLKPGASMASANQDLKRVMNELGARYPEAVGKKTAWTEPVANYLTRDSAMPMILSMGIVALVLLIACTNVASLLLAKGLERQREMATRVALGASRSQLIGQMLGESAILGLLGALGSLAVTWSVMAVFPVLLEGVSDLVVARIDGRVLLFTLAISTLAVLVFGALPAWRISRLDPGILMKDGSKGSEGRMHQRLRRALVVFEVAMAACVLITASLLLRSLSKLYEVPAGFRTQGLLAASFNLPKDTYSTPEAAQAVLDSMLAKASALPGVQSAALTTNMPLGSSGGATYEVEGQPLPKNQYYFGQERWVSADYFSTLGVPLLKGRAFTRQDPDSVCIVNETLAKKHWPGQDPIGKRVSVDGPTGPWLNVIGVSAATRQMLNEPLVPEVSVPIFHRGKVGGSWIALRTQGRPQLLVRSLREAIQGLDPDLALVKIQSGEELINGSMHMMVGRISGLLTAGFGILALVLAGVGLFGILSFLVAMRRREIGIRMALGASVKGVVRLFLRDGLWMVGVGLAFGVPCGFALGYAISTQLFGIVPMDPLTLIVVPLALGIVAIAACFGPALRAARIQPSVALRES